MLFCRRLVSDLISTLRNKIVAGSFTQDRQVFQSCYMMFAHSSMGIAKPPYGVMVRKDHTACFKM